MDRLIVFGCSLAYGIGLPDCWPWSNTSSPSKFSWPQLVSDAMNRKLINKSIPGASNKLIWHSINNFKFKTGDIVIVSWTFPNRYSVLKTPWQWHHLHHNHVDIDPVAVAYYTHLHSFYDSYSMSRLYVDHANRICKDMNLTIYHLIPDVQYSYIMKDIKNIPLYMSMYEDDYPKALDNDHLGMEGQIAFAFDLMNYLEVSRNLSKPRSLSILQLNKFRYIYFLIDYVGRKLRSKLWK